MHESQDCIFCQIVQGKIPTQIVWENEQFVVFPDLKPNAPVHLLVVSKKPYTTLEAALQTEPEFGAALLAAASSAAHAHHLADNYRLLMNVGTDIQQIKHFHLHLLGGWKPEDY